MGLRQETLEAGTREERCALAARAFLALPRPERPQTLVLAKSNEERRLVTQGIRAGLAAEGKLGASTTITTLHAMDFSEMHRKQAHNYLPGYVVKLHEAQGRDLRRGEALEVVGVDVRSNVLCVQTEKGKVRAIPCEALGPAVIYRKEQIEVARGDKLLWTRNDRRAGALNNDLFEVSKVSASGVTLRSLSGRGQERQSLAREGLHHVDHAWALTVHRSQGQTSKNVIMVVDERTTASDLLVGVTRATQSALVVTHDRAQVERVAAMKQEKEVAHDVAAATSSSPRERSPEGLTADSRQAIDRAQEMNTRAATEERREEKAEPKRTEEWELSL